MRKEIIIGMMLALAVFLIFLGINIVPLIVLSAAVTALFILFKKNRGLGRVQRALGTETVPKTSFDDVGGHRRTKEELTEALDFLIQRDQIEAYGIRPIKGLLLSGPPGTGKTLLAKAAAHYTDSVFMATSGSEFVEMYVGVGAQRIRKLFKEARNLAKKHHKKSALIFIDEIDVIGGKRSGNEHREYDQTLNQLLTEMDGLQSNHEVQLLLVAATNRPDMLDEALLRPGRFDRHIHVDLPDKAARKHILSLHLANKPLAEDVEIEQIAKETFGFSGAQLESVANEAAIYAMREKHQRIRQAHLAAAVDKVMMGEKTDREATKEERKRVAVHELGHAIMSEYVQPGSVSQVALSPRGKALGYVRQNPMKDQYLYTRSEIEAQIKVALAGAAAEELVYGDRSTGSRNDFEQANRHVALLIESGLSSLGILNLDLANKEQMQEESSRILNRLLVEVRQVLRDYEHVFHETLAILLQEEVISGEQFRRLLTKEKKTHPV